VAIDPRHLGIDRARLWGELERLATFSDAPAPAVTRVLYGEADRAARRYLDGLFAEVGLDVRSDALGNTFARWTGSDPTLPAVASGSHIDAIPHSGRFDGTVGVLGALEAIRALQRAGHTPRRSIELLLFTAEEPTRYGIGCLGSRALAGSLGPDEIRALRDEGGEGVERARRTAGFEGDLEGVALTRGSYHAFVELHIEQGPLLERDERPIGVVSAIAAPATLHVTLSGDGGHAGAVLMPARRDALVAGAHVASAVERAALATGSDDSVATVGIFDVHPRAVNSIPSRVFLTVDARDTELARRDDTVTAIHSAISAIASERGIDAEVEVINADPPATCAPEVTGAIRAAADDAGLGTMTMVSRAYHDALFMARLCPSGMIFIPCRDGISHRPDEYASPHALEDGVRVLAGALGELSG
jgi:N-carbamoyl-L-amino-acid hydrolase